MSSTQKQRQNFHLSDSESPNFSIKNQGMGSFQSLKSIVFKGVNLTLASLAHLETMQFFLGKLPMP